MKFILLSIFTSTLLLATQKDNVVIFNYPERTTVGVQEGFSSNKLNPIFDSFGASLMLIRSSDSGDITISCKRRLNVKSCSFAFMKSDSVSIDGKTTKVFSDSDDSLSLRTQNKLVMDFEGLQGDTFTLEITPEYFSAKSHKK